MEVIMMFYIVCTILAFITGIGAGCSIIMGILEFYIHAQWKDGIKCHYPTARGTMIITDIHQIETGDDEDDLVFAIIERK